MSSPSSTRRRLPMRHPVLVSDIGCGCRRPKLPFLLSSSSSSSSMSKLRNLPQTVPSSPLSTSNTSLCDTRLTTTTTTSSSDNSPEKPGSIKKLQASLLSSSTEGKKKKKKKKKKVLVDESEAVVKESLNPYVDFTESMLEMVSEKEIYAWDDLRDLLDRFLDLNSPHHHHLILRAFADTVTLLFSPPAAGVSEGKVTSRGGDRIPRRGQTCVFK